MCLCKHTYITHIFKASHFESLNMESDNNNNDDDDNETDNNDETETESDNMSILKNNKQNKKSEKDMKRYKSMVNKQMNKQFEAQKKAETKLKNSKNSKNVIEKWTKIDDNYVIKMDSDDNNGYIGVFGLDNLGNTCFFNSTLQNLLESRLFVKSLANDKLLEKKLKIKEKSLKKDKKNKRKNGLFMFVYRIFILFNIKCD